MTTTRSFTRPDGSVETRRVLKQRFADGHEETNEEVEVTPAQGRAEKAIAPRREGPVMRELRKQGPEKKSGGGWFWSS